MRLALKLFADFMSSGNTNIGKIESILAKQELYRMPFHEFAKSAILGIRRYYKASVAQVLNIFAPSSVPGASHWTASRILARLLLGSKASSPHGEGFIQTKILIKEYREAFGSAEDLLETASRLLSAGLIESEPPRAPLGLAQTEAVKITATGAYYWRFLVRSFAYLDLVYVDTPLADESLVKELAAVSEVTKDDLPLPELMKLRFDRVRKFLSYLGSFEVTESNQALRQGGIYGSLLSGKIREQIDKEIGEIAKRVGRAARGW
jgi:hypothetical protein